jgi:hypothetical protein
MTSVMIGACPAAACVVLRWPCVIRVIRFWPIVRMAMGFFAVEPVKTDAALFDFSALFGIRIL